MFRVFWDNFLPFLFLILVGYFSKKTSLLGESERKVINKLIINLTLPVFIFNVFLTTPLNLELVKIPILAWLVMAGAGLLAWLFSFWIKEPATKGGFLLVAALGNTGYFGYPLAQLFYGNKALAQAVFYDVFGTVVFTFTLGLLVAEYFGVGKEKLSVLKELLSFPPMIALLVGLVFNLLGVQLPGFLLTTLKMLGEISIPLIMVSIGLSLDFSVDSSLPFVFLASFIKLIFSPFLARYFGFWVGLKGTLYQVGLLQASTPSMMLSFIIGERYSLDTKLIASTIFFSTFLSFLTIPFIQSMF